MSKLFKLLGILFVLFLYASLIGCSPPWESGMTLILKVDTPRNGTTVNTPTVTVGGRVGGTESESAKVRVNDVDVPIKDGKFSTNLTLTEGTNVITIVATSGTASPSQTVTVTYVPAK